MCQSDCDCLTRVGARLRDENLQLTGYALAWPDMEARATINTAWIDRAKAPKGKRNSPTTMFASHCPFCGRKYETTQPPQSPVKE